MSIPLNGDATTKARRTRPNNGGFGNAATKQRIRLIVGQRAKQRRFAASNQPRQSVAEYIASGGIVTICPPAYAAPSSADKGSGRR